MQELSPIQLVERNRNARRTGFMTTFFPTDLNLWRRLKIGWIESNDAICCAIGTHANRCKTDDDVRWDSWERYAYFVALSSAARSQTGRFRPELRIASATTHPSSGRSRTEKISPKAFFFATRGRPIFFGFFPMIYLTVFYFLCTNTQAQLTEAKPFQQSARTSLERLAIQRHPASTGAGNERLAVNIRTHQGASSASKSRSLKIEATGDFWRGDVKPKIRLCGNWLEAAGFKPGNRVEIVFEQPGTLMLRFVETPLEVVV